MIFRCLNDFLSAARAVSAPAQFLSLSATCCLDYYIPQTCLVELLFRFVLMAGWLDGGSTIGHIILQKKGIKGEKSIKKFLCHFLSLIWSPAFVCLSLLVVSNTHLSSKSARSPPARIPGDLISVLLRRLMRFAIPGPRDLLYTCTRYTCSGLHIIVANATTMCLQYTDPLGL